MHPRIRVSNHYRVFKYDGTEPVLETPVDVLYEVRLLYSAGALKLYCHPGMQPSDHLTYDTFDTFYTAARIKYLQGRASA